MKFNAKAIRLGFGENMRGMVNSSGNIILSYKGRDGVSKLKKITRTAGGFTAEIVGEIGATFAQPLFDGVVVRVQGATTLGITNSDY